MAKFTKETHEFAGYKTFKIIGIIENPEGAKHEKIIVVYKNPTIDYIEVVALDREGRYCCLDSKGRHCCNSVNSLEPISNWNLIERETVWYQAVVDSNKKGYITRSRKFKTEKECKKYYQNNDSFVMAVRFEI